jgi:hypothetical protein
MLKHIVLFRRKADVQPQPALEQRLVAQMDALVQQIGFIREWKLSANELDRPICWGYVGRSGLHGGLTGARRGQARASWNPDVLTY